MVEVKTHYRKVNGKMIRVRRFYRKEKTPHFIAQRLQDPALFDPESFRRIKSGDALLTIACPKGKFKGGRCQDGTEVQSIWRPK